MSFAGSQFARTARLRCPSSPLSAISVGRRCRTYSLLHPRLIPTLLSARAAAIAARIRRDSAISAALHWFRLLRLPPLLRLPHLLLRRQLIRRSPRNLLPSPFRKLPVWRSRLKRPHRKRRFARIAAQRWSRIATSAWSAEPNSERMPCL